MQIDDPILVNHDDLVDHLGKLKKRSDDIKSRGGEMRKFSGQFNDDFGYNQVAKNMLMRLHNMNEEKRADCLRTLLPGLESMVPAWLGQSTPDMFDEPEAVEPTAEDESNVVPMTDEELDADTQEFNEAVDETMPAAE